MSAAIGVPAAAVRRLPAGAMGIAALLVLAFGVVPLIGGEYLYDAILTPFLALALAGLGLNILTGYAGQISLGTSAFMAVGAYAAYNLILRVPGLPLLVSLVLAGVITACIGLLFGLPSLRLRGFYLAVTTLTAQFFVPWALNKVSWFSNDDPSGVISAPPLAIGPIVVDSARGRYVFCLSVVTVATLLVWRLIRSTTGRGFVAVRDHETAAQVIGIPVLKVKLIAFASSSFIIGLAGALWAFAYLRTVEPNGFDLDRSFQILFIVIIGGLASLRGAFLGAAFMVVLPLLLSRAGAATFGATVNSGMLEMVQRMLIGALIVAFLILEPAGLTALLDRLWRRRRSVRATR